MVELKIDGKTETNLDIDIDDFKSVLVIRDDDGKVKSINFTSSSNFMLQTKDGETTTVFRGKND